MDARPNLDPIFSPRSIAVVGASRRRDSIGYALLHNLLQSEFQGAIYPVNPGAFAIHSLRSYPSLDAITDPIDLAVIALPRDGVIAAARAAIDKGVRGLVVISAGFAEVGAEGREREAELAALVRRAGIRMIGPNCMGVINTDPRVSLNATFAPTPARRGSIGFVSQSGALGVAILNVAQDLGIGLTQFVSMGNKADVSGNDLLERWENDPETRVICMYLESFGNPRRFTEIAKRVAAKKPILIVKSGRTAEGARAASSHTGALAASTGTDLPVSAFLEQCGVLRANTIEELFDIARAFDRSPLPQGDRVAIVTNAGGPGIMATDACVNSGLTMAKLGEDTRRELRSFLPPEASVENPVDMIASADAPKYERALAAVLADEGVDMAIVIHVTPMLSKPIDVIEAAAAGARGADKPVLAVMMATDDFYIDVKGRGDLPPVYRFPESAARALASLHRYAQYRLRPAIPAPTDLVLDDAAIRDALGRASPLDGYLSPADTARVLTACGIPMVETRVARTVEEAARTARDIGFPVALKAVAPRLVHKSDVGAVVLDLDDEAALVKAADDMKVRLGALGYSVEGFVVQGMAGKGHELIFGISTDPRFGPLLMFGLGGRYVEVFRDVRFGTTPLSPSDALDMVRGIRGYKLLEGVRGDLGVDIGELTRILLTLSRLAERHPEIDELDINPFVAAQGEGRSLALDARIRVHSRASLPPPPSGRGA